MQLEEDLNKAMAERDAELAGKNEKITALQVERRNHLISLIIPGYYSIESVRVLSENNILFLLTQNTSLNDYFIIFFPFEVQ